MAPKESNSPAINVPDWMFKIFLAVLGCIIAFSLQRKSAGDDKMNDKLDQIIKIQEEQKGDFKVISREVARGDERMNEYGERLTEYSDRLRELELKEARREKK